MSSNAKPIYKEELTTNSSTISPSKNVDEKIKEAKAEEKAIDSAKVVTEKEVNKSILNGLGDLLKMALAHGVNGQIDTSDVNMSYINKTYAIYQEIQANENYKKLILDKVGDDKKKFAKTKRQKLKEINDFVGLDSALYAAQYRLASAIGPVIDSWLGGEDYLQQILMLIQNLRAIWEPICTALEPIRDYYSDLGSKANISINGRNANLPLGLMAVDCLNAIIDYFENLMHQIEMLATKYSKDEIDALLKVAARPDDNWSNSGLNLVKNLLKLCIDCIQPYIQNCLLMLLLDAVDMFIQILKDAGLLEKPSGPLALIPIALTLARSIAMGGLQRVEEQIREAGNKLIKIVKCMEAFAKDPDMFTSSEISALDYRVGEQLAKDGKGLVGTGDYFGNKFVSDTVTREFRNRIGSAITDGMILRQNAFSDFNLAQRLNDYLNEKEDIERIDRMSTAMSQKSSQDGTEIAQTLNSAATATSEQKVFPTVNSY